MQSVPEAPEEGARFALDVGGHLGQVERAPERAEHPVHLGVLEGLALVVVFVGHAEEHDAEGGGWRAGHRGGVGVEQSSALLNDRPVVGMLLGQLLQVLRGPRLLLFGDLGDREPADEAPELCVRLLLEVRQGLVGGERRVEVREELVELLVGERLAPVVVVGDGGEPHLLERDGDVGEGRWRCLVRVGGAAAAGQEHSQTE